MKTAAQILEEINQIVGNLIHPPVDPQPTYDLILEKIEDARKAKVDEVLLALVEDSSKVALEMEPGDNCAAIAHILCAIEEWKEDNPYFMGHLE